MLFNSVEFLLLFLPIVVAVYYILNKINLQKLSKVWLIVASLYFYGYYNKSYVAIIVSSILINYFIGKALYNIDKEKVTRKVLLIVGIVFNIGLLGYFKYLDFFIDNINSIFNKDLPLLKIALPLGISFFTFQQVSFIVDSYKEKKYKLKFLDYSLFVTFFPQLIAGPIVLPTEMCPQFSEKVNKKINYKNMNSGLYMLAIGLAKKIIIADTLALLVSAGFDNTSTITIMEAWVSTLAFTFQLYFDFSGYCDMAMGIALMFNIRLPLNFNSPYKSTNIQEFWKRWHITLGRFLTNYIYIPLGGSRKGFKRTLINLFIVFILSGLWHGAGWTFILWGSMHGISMVVHRVWKSYGKALNKFWGWFITFNLVNLFWVFFRANSIESALNIIKGLFSFKTLFAGITPEYRNIFEGHIGGVKTSLIILLVAMIISFLGKNTKDKVKDMKLNKKTSIEIIVYIMVALLLILSSRVSTFLYFNF